MSIQQVTPPPDQTYPIQSHFEPAVTTDELQRMKSIAGHKVHHYRITPQQATLITSIVIAVFALAASVFLSPFILFAVAASVGVGIYCYIRKDMDSDEVRKKEQLFLASKQPIEIVKNNDYLKNMIDYDLGTDSTAIGRHRMYVKFTHLKESYTQALLCKKTYEKNVESRVKELSKPARAKATELKKEPLNTAQEHIRQEDLLKSTLAISKELLGQKQTALHNLSNHSEPRSEVAHKRFVLAAEIQVIESTIRKTTDAIKAHESDRRQKELEVSLIENKLREALTPLGNWEWAQQRYITNNFDDAQQSLQRTFLAST